MSFFRMLAIIFVSFFYFFIGFNLGHKCWVFEVPRMYFCQCVISPLHDIAVKSGSDCKMSKVTGKYDCDSDHLESPGL